MIGTLAGALEARHIPAAPDLMYCEAVGTVSDPDGVLVIAGIDVTMHLTVPKSKRTEADRALKHFVRDCPIHQSLIRAFPINVDAVVTEIDDYPGPRSWSA